MYSTLNVLRQPVISQHAWLGSGSMMNARAVIPIVVRVACCSGILLLATPPLRRLSWRCTTSFLGTPTYGRPHPFSQHPDPLAELLFTPFNQQTPHLHEVSHKSVTLRCVFTDSERTPVTATRTGDEFHVGNNGEANQ